MAKEKKVVAKEECTLCKKLYAKGSGMASHLKKCFQEQRLALASAQLADNAQLSDQLDESGTEVSDLDSETEAEVIKEVKKKSAKKSSKKSVSIASESEDNMTINSASDAKIDNMQNQINQLSTQLSNLVATLNVMANTGLIPKPPTEPSASASVPSVAAFGPPPSIPASSAASSVTTSLKSVSVNKDGMKYTKLTSGKSSESSGVPIGALIVKSPFVGDIKVPVYERDDKKIYISPSKDGVATKRYVSQPQLTRIVPCTPQELKEWTLEK